MNEIIDLVSSIGFPAVMCVMLIDYIKDRDEKLQASFDHMTEAFTEFKALIQAQGGNEHDV